MKTASEIRAAKAQGQGRARDLAKSLGLTEAQLVASEVGHGTVAIVADPNHLIPMIEPLGRCMALTRNESCVIEKDGHYRAFHKGDHACMTLDPQIDMRMFPKHWVHGFAVEEETNAGLRRSVQVFDAFGEAVHKIYLREETGLAAWDQLRRDLALPVQADTLSITEAPALEPARSVPEKRDILLKEWARLTDTHQFLRLCSKLRMNRLGAYRIAGAPWVRALAPSAVPAALTAVQREGIDFMMFVGNRGCIEIHTGPIHTLKTVGPWENVLDDGFNLHLRQDHVAEVWAVEKPTQRGPALSIEAFDAQEQLIFQAFGVSKETNDTRPQWRRIVEALPDREESFV